MAQQTMNTSSTLWCPQVNVCYGVDGPISDVYEGDEVKGQPEGQGVLHRRHVLHHTSLCAIT